jgi:hypothetical protein
LDRHAGLFQELYKAPRRNTEFVVTHWVRCKYWRPTLQTGWRSKKRIFEWWEASTRKS